MVQPGDMDMSKSAGKKTRKKVLSRLGLLLLAMDFDLLEIDEPA